MFLSLELTKHSDFSVDATNVYILKTDVAGHLVKPDVFHLAPSTGVIGI